MASSTRTGPALDRSPPGLRRPLLFVAAAAIEGAALERALPADAGSRLLVAGVGRAGDAAVAATLTGKAAGSRDGATDEPADGDRVHRPGTLLALGLAGGLAPGLEAGDVVLTEAWRGAAAPHPEGPTAAPRAIAAVARALAAAGIDSHRGPGVTVDAPFHDAGARDRLHAATGALTVEMEGARWAALAADAGVDFASVRVISDRADLRLPRPRHELLDAGGQVRWEAWLAAVATATDRDPADALRDLHAARREWIAAMRALERVGGALAKLLG